MKTQTDQDGIWYSPREAARYVGLATRTLWMYARVGTYLLGGQKLLARKFVDGQGRRTNFYLKSDLDQLLAAKAKGNPLRGNAQWVWVHDARTEFRWSKGLLSSWTRRDNPYTGRRIRHKKEFVARRNGKGIRSLFLWRADLEEIEAKRTARAKAIPEGHILLEEAAELLNVGKGVLWRRIQAGELPGAKVRVPFEDRKKAQIKKLWVIPRAAVEAFKARYQEAKRKEYRDSLGRLGLPPKEAGKRYPAATKDVLSAHRNKPCPWLGGDVLHAWRAEGNGRKGTPQGSFWVYLEDDLKWLKPPARGAVALKQPFRDQQGVWWPGAEAAVMTGMHQGWLRCLREKPSRNFLGGRRLRAQQIPNPNPKWGRYKKIWVYHEGDLRELAAKRNGLPVPTSRDRKGAEASQWAVNTNPPTVQGRTPSGLSPSQENQPDPSRAKRRGRPKGSIDLDVQKREREMLAAWDEGRFGGNKAAAGRAFGFHRSDATKLINAHTAQRCRK